MSVRFPGVVVVDGPGFAGDDDGSAFAVDEGGVAYVRDDQQLGATLSSFTPRDPQQLQAQSPTSEMLFPKDGAWLHVRGQRVGPALQLRGGDVVACGPRTLQLVDDLGALVRRRVVGGRVVVRPRGPWALGLAPQSLWTLADDPAHDVFVSGDAALNTFAQRLRHTGVAFVDFAGRVDARVARRLARQARRKLTRAGVTFDGVVVPGAASVESHEAVFAALTALSGGDFDGPAADLDEVKAFVRSFDARGWERERVLREECAIVAGS